MAVSLRGDFGRVAAAGVGVEYQGWASGPAVVGACRDLRRRDAQRCGEDRRCRASDHLGVGVCASRLAGPRRAAEWQCAGAARLAVRIQPYYDPTMVIVTAAH